MDLTSLRWRSALLEGVGVLTGILIAFGIDAAWDMRQDRAREAGYLEALSAELGTNRDRFEEYQRRLQGSLDGDEYALREVVFAEGAVTPDDLLEMSRRSSGSFIVLPERAALADILSSGGVAYIEEAGIRRLIARYADLLDRQLVGQENLVDFWRGRMAMYYEGHSSLYDMIGGVSWYEGGLPSGLGGFDGDVEAFAANREFANLLVHRSILIGLARSATDDLLDVMAELSNALAEAV